VSRNGPKRGKRSKPERGHAWQWFVQ
jgi:hypothetical protein